MACDMTLSSAVLHCQFEISYPTHKAAGSTRGSNGRTCRDRNKLWTVVLLKIRTSSFDVSFLAAQVALLCDC